MMKFAALYARFVMRALSARMEYRVNFFASQASNLIYYASVYAQIWIILQQFGSLGGFGFREVAFIYSLNLLTYFIAGMFLWAPMRSLEGLVTSGDFDVVLLRPLDPLLHLILRHFDASMATKAVFAGAISCLALVELLDVSDPLVLLWFVSTVVGGSLIQASVLLIAGATSFWIVRSRDLVDVMIYSVRRWVDFPLSIYPGFIRVFFSIVIPYAFVNYLPVVGMIRPSEFATPNIVAFSAIGAGTVSFSLALALWRQGVKRYEGSGS